MSVTIAEKLNPSRKIIAWVISILATGHLHA